MEIDRTIEDELKAALETLHRQTANDRKNKEDENIITQQCDVLEMDWQARLNDNELGELRGCKRGCNTAVEEFHVQQRMADYMRLSGELPAMTPNEQVAFWEGNRPNIKPEIWQEEQRQMSREAFERARPHIQDRYADLREGLSRAVDDIREGKSPSLSFLVESQVSREAEAANTRSMPWEAVGSSSIDEHDEQKRTIKRSR